MEKSVDIVEKLEFSTTKPKEWDNRGDNNVHNFLHIFRMDAAATGLRNREKYGNQIVKIHEKVWKNQNMYYRDGRRGHCRQKNL